MIEGTDRRILHLINLTAVPEPCWNSAQPDAPELTGLQLRLQCLAPPRTVWWASPDFAGGRPQPLLWRLEPDPGAGRVVVVTALYLHYWSMLVVEA